MDFSKEIKIGTKTIADDQPVFIIAEAGVNHKGNLEIAKKLIDVAIEAGADAIKFQAFKTENLILESTAKAPYQNITTGREESQFEMLKKLEINKAQNKELISYCDDKGIIFLTTPFDEQSLEELVELDIAAIKVASTDTTNPMFLKKIAKTGKPVILSTGMSYLNEVTLALEEIFPYNRDVVLLQCTANYPIRNDEANLNVLTTYKKEFDILLGYSDHTTGIGASPYAIPLGARLVEKHFTLDTGDKGPDHRASLAPDELIEYVREIRKVESYMGSGIKAPTFEESNNRKFLQKCLVAATDIARGEIFTEENMVAKRTGGTGISPIYYKEMLEKKASRDYKANDIINEI